MYMFRSRTRSQPDLDQTDPKRMTRPEYDWAYGHIHKKSEIGAPPPHQNGFVGMDSSVMNL